MSREGSHEENAYALQRSTFAATAPRSAVAELGVVRRCYHHHEMTTLKKAIGYTTLATFVLAFALGIIGATGIATIQQAALPWVFGIALSQSVGCVITVIKSEHYFRDPAVEQALREEISQMNIHHAEAIAELGRKHTDRIHEIQADYRQRYPAQKTTAFS
jgi:hypothetical protein